MEFTGEISSELQGWHKVREVIPAELVRLGGWGKQKLFSHFTVSCPSAPSWLVMSPGLAAELGFVLDLTRVQPWGGEILWAHTKGNSSCLLVFLLEKKQFASPLPQPQLLACVPVLSSCVWHSLVVTAGHTGVELWGCSAGCTPLPNLLGKHRSTWWPKAFVTGRICTGHCCWCRGRLWPAVQDKDFFVQHKFLYPATLHEVALQTKS